MMEFVSWDDDIPNMMGKMKAIFQTTNQHRVLGKTWQNLFSIKPPHQDFELMLSKLGCLLRLFLDMMTCFSISNFPRTANDKPRT